MFKKKKKKSKPNNLYCEQTCINDNENFQVKDS